MSTLKELFREKKWYGSPIRVKIVCQGSGGNENRYGVADGTLAAEMVLYEKSLAPKIMCGTSVMVINATLREGVHKVVEIRKNARVCKTGTVEVPHHLELEASSFVNPAPAAFLSIAEVKTSPLKTLTSVKGQVVGQEMAKTVCAKGRDVEVKNITVREQGHSCRVALWRDQSSTDVSIGDFLEVTNVVVNEFDNERYVNTTRHSVVTKVNREKVLEEAEVIGFDCDIGEDKVQLTSNQEGFPTYTINKALLKEAFGEGSDDIEVEELLISRVPFKCKFVLNEKGMDCFSLIVD